MKKGLPVIAVFLIVGISVAIMLLLKPKNEEHNNDCVVDIKGE